MSDFKYSLAITSNSREDIDQALNKLEKVDIIPNTLMLDSMNKTPRNDGLYYASLDTERLLPYGTSKGWGAEEHEAFFHHLSLELPGAMFEFSGVCIDDPQNEMFLKAFHNGLYKEVWQDNSDLSERLLQVPWRFYGEPEQEASLTDLRSIYVLTCTHETRYGIDSYASLHPSWEAAEAHVKNVKDGCAFGEYGEGEYFNYDIKEHVLDINKLSPVRSQEKPSLSNVLADAQARAEDQIKEGVPKTIKDAPSL